MNLRFGWPVDVKLEGMARERFPAIAGALLQRPSALNYPLSQISVAARTSTAGCKCQSTVVASYRVAVKNKRRTSGGHLFAPGPLTCQDHTERTEPAASQHRVRKRTWRPIMYFYALPCWGPWMGLSYQCRPRRGWPKRSMDKIFWQRSGEVCDAQPAEQDIPFCSLGQPVGRASTSPAILIGQVTLHYRRYPTLPCLLRWRQR